MATTRAERLTCDARTRKRLSALEGMRRWHIQRAQQQPHFLAGNCAQKATFQQLLLALQGVATQAHGQGGSGWQGPRGPECGAPPPCPQAAMAGQPRFVTEVS